MKDCAKTVAAFVPGYVEDLEDLEDFEPEAVTHNNSSKCTSDERYDNSKEVAELKAREEVEKRLKEVEEQRRKEKEETKRKLREEQSRKEKEEAERRIKEQEKREAEKPTRRETESEVQWNDGESQAVVETQVEFEKPTFHSISV